MNDFSKLDTCFEIDLNSIVKLDWISEILPVFSSPRFFNIDVIVTKWSLIDLSSSSFSTNLFNTIVSSLIFSEIQYLVPITIYALLQYCFLLFYLGNMNLKSKF